MAAPALAPPQAQAAGVQTEGNRSEVGFYGVVRTDAIFDDSRANAFQTPTFIRPEPDGSDSSSNFTFHPRLTRIGLNYRAPGTLDSLAGARLTGKIEMDFQNGGRESRAVPRYRHAYLQLGWGPHALLVGQTWDLISPLYPTVNADTLMGNAGNLGDRRMQLRYSYDPSTGLSFRTALGLTGAVDGQDADSNGILDGEASTLPNFQGRVGYNSSRVVAGAWAHYAQLQTATAFGGKNEFDGYSFGGDFDFRFTPQFNLRGEVWVGLGATWATCAVASASPSIRPPARRSTAEAVGSNWAYALDSMASAPVTPWTTPRTATYPTAGRLRTARGMLPTNSASLHRSPSEWTTCTGGPTSRG